MDSALFLILYQHSKFTGHLFTTAELHNGYAEGQWKSIHHVYCNKYNYLMQLFSHRTVYCRWFFNCIDPILLNLQIKLISELLVVSCWLNYVYIRGHGSLLHFSSSKFSPLQSFPPSVLPLQSRFRFLIPLPQALVHSFHLPQPVQEPSPKTCAGNRVKDLQ